MITLERILVPTDFSDYSRPAITYACELAKRFSAELQVLHVVPPPLIAGPYIGAVSDAVLQPEVAAKRELEELEDPGFQQVARVERVIRMGTPFVEIVRYAKENDIDLIVMGTHGRTGVVHALIGSVAEKVVRKAPCPVLTVRPEGHQFVLP
jgi:nucleotide-binding universal stress UspA family protein